MKSILSGFLVAFSMYSAIPVPQIGWEKKTMRWALSFLPLVGLVVGGAEWLWFWFCGGVGASAVFYAIVAALLPLVISGGIHLDGLCDTCDALCSFGDRDKRLAILKDSHVGAFGPLWVMAFLLAETACFAQAYETPRYLPCALMGFALARCFGAKKVVAMPCAKDTGLAHLFAENSDKKAVIVTLMVECLIALAALGLWLSGHGISVFVCGVLLTVLWDQGHQRLCMRVFGGNTGDLAGFFISTTELLWIAVAAFVGLLG